MSAAPVRKVFDGLGPSGKQAIRHSMQHWLHRTSAVKLLANYAHKPLHVIPTYPIKVQLPSGLRSALSTGLNLKSVFAALAATPPTPPTKHADTGRQSGANPSSREEAGLRSWGVEELIDAGLKLDYHHLRELELLL